MTIPGIVHDIHGVGKRQKPPGDVAVRRMRDMRYGGGMPGEKGGMSHHPVEERIGTACLTGPSSICIRRLIDIMVS